MDLGGCPRRIGPAGRRLGLVGAAEDPREPSVSGTGRRADSRRDGRTRSSWMADQRGHRQGFTPDDTDRSGWVCVPALSAVNGEDFGPDIPLGFDPVGAPGSADSRALRRRGDRVVGLGGVPWIFGGARGVQTTTGGVLVGADTTPVSAPPRPCRTPPGRRGHPPRSTGHPLGRRAVLTDRGLGSHRKWGRRHGG